MSDGPLGLIAGNGRLPLLIAQGAAALGRPIACVGLAGQYEAELPGVCDTFARAGVVRIGRWIRLLRRWNVTEAVLVGGVNKTRMYDPLRVFRQVPDWRAFRLWYRTLNQDKRTDVLLRAVANEMANEGIQLISPSTFIPDHMAHAGPMTRKRPTSAQQADIDFALPIARQVCALDVGQAIAVKEREVIAIEAIEGTDALIERAGSLCRSGGWVMIKIAKPMQDMRMDLPTVGLRTIEKLRAARCGALAVEAGRVILLDKPQLIEAADRAGVAMVGV